MASRCKVVVLGAGVSGLTTALLLAESASISVTIVARDQPGDYSSEYASPWAGANYIPQCVPGCQDQLFERDTWPDLKRLASERPEAGVHFQKTMAYKRAGDDDDVDQGSAWPKVRAAKEAWYRDILDDFHVSSNVPTGYDYATCFTSVCINTAVYLPWLLSECLKKGVLVRRGTVQALSQAALMHHTRAKADIVVNCTGLGSMKLADVKDETMYPIRGQITIVRNSPGLMVDTSSTGDGPEEVCYVMERAAGGGTVLGGTYQANNWQSQPDHNTALRIMQRAADICPELLDGQGVAKLDVVRHAVGLRPARKKGIRLEREQMADHWVVHNYGHGGYGYQTSWASSRAAVQLVHHIQASLN